VIEDVTMKLFRLDHIRLASVATAAGLLWLMPPAKAQQFFHNPDEAASALASAVKSGMRQDVLKVLGADGEDIIDSGDEVADKAAREKFLAAYDAKHAVKVDGKKASLIIGADDFPFPIPLVHTKAGWEFDTDAGQQEILYRRIGRNELDTIQTILAFVDAENEYADKDRGDGVGTYAQRIVSGPGKKDGLYWPSDNNDSPLGELAAEANAEGYKSGSGPQPYHGYYYRILTQQGSSASGGALNYIVKGKMIGGFALVAYPADYGNSGVMTFIVNHDGTVYQKDLGEHTETIVKTMTSFDPDKSWKKVDTASE
jgi:Protein of unknown function (DUF2950)